MDAEKQNNATKKTTAVAAAEHYITREQALNVAPKPPAWRIPLRAFVAALAIMM